MHGIPGGYIRTIMSLAVLAIGMDVLLLTGSWAQSGQASNYYLAWHDGAPVDTGPPQLWHLDERGHAERVAFTYPCGGAGIFGYGSTRPLLSPNAAWVAFGYGDDLWLHNVATGDTVRATHLEVEPADSDLPVTAFIHSWSSDGAELLYSVAQIPQFTKRIPSHPSPRCGYYGLDPSTGHSARKAIPYPLLAWLPGDSAVVSGASNILYLTGGSDSMRAIGEPGFYTQGAASRDGRSLVAVYSPVGKDWEVVRIDLQSGRQTRLAGPNSLGFSYPSYSPSGRHVAYVETDSLLDGYPVQGLAVDGRRLFSCERGIISPKWISEATVALSCRSSLVVLNVETRQVQARVELDSLRCNWE